MQNIFSIDRQSIISAWAWAMIHSVWIGLVFAFLYYAFLQNFSFKSAKVKYGAGITMLLILPIISVSIFINCLPDHIPNTSITYSSNLPLAASHPMVAEPSMVHPTFSSWINDHSNSFFLFWILGMVMMSVRMLIAYAQIERIKTQATCITDRSINEVFKKIYDSSHLQKIVKLASSASIDMPCTLGHIKPIIFLPVSIINQLTVEETYAVIAHEMAHILRKDYLQNLIISFIEIIYFFHPSVWWFSSTLKSLREQCCDEIAVQLGAEKIALSKALVQLEEQQASPLLAMAFSHKHQLLNRIQRLFNPSMKNEFNINRSQAPIIICSLALLLAFTRPEVNDYFHSNKMPLLNAFLWDEKPGTDTIKPKSKIEKISKDNGKDKMELKLKDNKIEELKVNDKVIPPSEYTKYTVETEQLQKELKEIESPAERKGRVRVYNDFDPEIIIKKLDDGDENEEKIIIAPGEKILRGGGKVLTIPRGSRPYIYNGKGNSFGYGFGGNGKNNGKSWSWSGDDNNITWNIEGDSNNITIDGNRIIIKDEKGDIIVDMGEHDRWPSGKAFNFHFPDNAFSGLEKLKELEGLDRWPNDMHFKFDLDEELHRKLKENMKELLEERKSNSERLRKELKDAELYKHDLKDKAEGLKKLYGYGDEWNDREWKRWGDAWGDNFSKRHARKNLNEAITEHLLEDKIIKPGESYDFKYDDNGLRINGKKQSEETYTKYKKLLKEYTGINMNEGKIAFSFNGTAPKSND